MYGDVPSFLAALLTDLIYTFHTGSLSDLGIDPVGNPRKMTKLSQMVEHSVKVYA